MPGKDASGPRDGTDVRDGYGAFRQPKFECGCCEMLFSRVCGVRQNLYVFSLYRNPDLDDWIFDCLLTSMAAVKAEDVRASFLVVGDLNGRHQEWLGSTIEMDRMSKFAYPRMRIRMLIPAREDPRIRIHMRIPVSRYPRMRTRLRIFVSYLNNTSYCQRELLLLQNTYYYIIMIIPNINY